jgi:hypothetical protein
VVRRRSNGRAGRLQQQFTHRTDSPQPSPPTVLPQQLAQRPSVINSLSLEWNEQTFVPPMSGPIVEGEWVVPKALVRRGANVLRLRVADLVSPALFGHAGDARLLGAQVQRLVIEPTQPATAAASSTATR